MARTRRRGNPLMRGGITLTILGFGSTVLHSATSGEFVLLAWANGAQPYVGIVVGLIGVGLLATPFILRARDGSPGQPSMPAAGYAPAPGGFGAPQGGPAPTGFPQPGGFDQPTTAFGAPTGPAQQVGPVPPGGFPAPAAWEQQAGFGQPPAPQQFGNGAPAQQPYGGAPQFGQQGPTQPGTGNGWQQR